LLLLLLLLLAFCVHYQRWVLHEEEFLTNTFVFVWCKPRAEFQISSWGIGISRTSRYTDKMR
jgi:hypothetical protein